MIRLTDATVLALTKLRTRKIRTITTIIISALVFAILIAALSVSQGIFKSLADFSHEGLNDRYLVRASKAGSAELGVFKKPDLIERSKQLYDEMVVSKKAYAKELGVAYDPTTEPLPYTSYDGDEKNNHLYLNNPIALQVLTEYYATKPQAGLTELKAAAAAYHPKDFIRSVYSGSNLGVATMLHGKEAYPDPSAEQQPDAKKDHVFEQGIQLADIGLTKSFMLPSSNWSPSSKRVPVVVTQSGAEQLLGLDKLPKDATSDEQLRFIARVRNEVASVKFSACYRNDISKQQINQAVMLPYDIKKNAGDKTYRQPAIQYQTPADDSCGAAVVSKDTRPSAQKQYEEKQALFNERFGAVVRPIQEKINFQVVGITPDPPQYQAANAVDGLLSAVVGASSLYTMTIPQQLYDQLPADNHYDDIFMPVNSITSWIGGGDMATYSVEFANADDARHFIDEQACDGGTVTQCAAKGKLFSLDATGSNSIALADLQNKVTNILKIAALVAAGIAVVIMGGMIGRTIADGRRETAVFRAIGFKRFDITAVYAVYTLMLSLYVAVAALVIGLAAAFVLDAYYWSMFTVKAQLAFGASNPTREFHLFTLDTPWLWLVALLIVALGFVAMAIPLLRNIRRNPIKDMRDE